MDKAKPASDISMTASSVENVLEPCQNPGMVLAHPGFRKYKIFVSYATENEDFVKRLIEYVELEGNLSCFHAPRDIEPRADWRAEIASRIRECHVMLLVYTPEAEKSEWVRQELREAAQNERPVWPIRAGGAHLYEILRIHGLDGRQAFDCPPEKVAECFDRLRAELTKEWELLNRGKVDPNDSPYPGFQPFGKEWAAYYFGRGKDAADLAEALCREHDSRNKTGDDRLLFLYGPSGAGKTSLLTVGLRKHLQQENWLRDPISIPDYVKEGETADNLMRAAIAQLRADGPSPSPEELEIGLVEQICAAAKQIKYRRYILVFDQTEELFQRDAEQSVTFLRYASSLLNESWSLGTDVRIVVSFREESWGRAEEYSQHAEVSFSVRAVRKLTLDQAIDCIVEPARARRVEFDPALARALAAALADRVGADATVEPRKVSQVCKLLWQRVGNSKGGPHFRIGPGYLAEYGETAEERAQGFVGHVLETDLDDAVREIASKESSRQDAAIRDAKAQEDFIKLSLLEFVTNQRRCRVQEHIQNGVRCVGRLPGEIVDEFVKRGLVRKCEDSEYELVHDFLAEKIEDYRGKVAFELSFNQLLSAMRKAEGRHVFNTETTLLTDLEAALKNNLYFRNEEAEFLTRCALGSLRKNLQGKTISLADWARKLGDASRDMLEGVLRDGLSQEADDSVRLDVLELLHVREVRERVGPGLPELCAQIQALAVDGSLEVRRAACSALVALDRDAEPNVKGLFADYKDPRKSGRARTAIGLLHDAVDTFKGTGEVFWPLWTWLPLLSRGRIRWELCLLRGRESFGRIAYITTVSAVSTAIGASVPFIICGFTGSSLTMGEPNLVAGILQGGMGGLVWGAVVSFLLLLYMVVWRGGRFRRSTRDTFAILTAAALGGLLGGTINTAIVAGGFSPDMVGKAGWLLKGHEVGDKMPFRTRMIETWQTRFGLALPILGIALGIGVAVSLIRILGDSTEKWAGDQSALRTPGEAWNCTKRIARSVFRRAWYNAIPLVFGAFLVRNLLEPGSGLAQSPPLDWRTAGIAIVVFFGSLLVEVGFLFGVLSARVGVSMGESADFLRPGGPE